MLVAGGSYDSYCFWEWGGRTVSPSLRAHSTHGKTILSTPVLKRSRPSFIFFLTTPVDTFNFSLHDSAGTLVHSNPRPLHCLFIHAQAGSCLSSRRDHCLLLILMHRYSSGLDSHSELGDVHSHSRFDFLLWSSLYFGMGVYSFHAQFGSQYFFSLPLRGLCMYYR